MPRRSYLMVVFGVLVLLTLVWYFRLPVRPARIVSAHVINMDESKDRLAECMEHAHAAQINAVRWPAVDSRNFKEDDVVRYKLSKYIWKWAVENKKPGVLGCFLSHKTLLLHLESEVPAAAGDAHLILEDDAYIPPDFWAQWNKVCADLPSDWDIVQLGVTFPNLKQLKGDVHVHLNDRGNVGAFAYVVRHRALSKINAHLEYMNDPIDVMFRKKWREWNYYIVWPEICPHNDHGESTIVREPT